MKYIICSEFMIFFQKMNGGEVYKKQNAHEYFIR